MKTYALDASALLAFLEDKPAASKVDELLREALQGRIDIVMSAINYGEVYGVVIRKQGFDQAATTMSAVRPLPIQVVDVTPERACRAAEIKAKHKLYYVDSFAAALAMEYKATLVTSDSDFRKLGHGVAILWLRT